VGTFGADVCATTAAGSTNAATNAISNIASVEVIAILLIGEFLSFIQSKVPLVESVRLIGSNAFSKRHAQTREVRVSLDLWVTFPVERGRQTEDGQLIAIHLYTNDALLEG